MGEWILDRYREALGSLLGWSATVVGALLIAFCLGYWIGHGEITSAQQTARAFGQLFFVWLGFPQLIFAWVVTAFVWYLPLRLPLSIYQGGLLALHFVVWTAVTHSMVVALANAKFFHF